MTQAERVFITPRTTASEFLTTVNRLQISLMIRDPFVARAFRAAMMTAWRRATSRSIARDQWRRRRARSCDDGGLNDGRVHQCRNTARQETHIFGG
jgi:hypothetical protein